MTDFHAIGGSEETIGFTSKALKTLRYARSEYVENVEDAESGPFAKCTLLKFDKRLAGDMQVCSF